MQPNILDLLLSLLIYDREAGELRWRDGHQYAGRLAGSITTSGYRQITFRGARIHAHTLIWFIETGAFPTCDLDHINRNKIDNRLANLREATRSENTMNSPARRTNKLGVRGVVYDPKKRLYRATIVKDGKRHSCGRHKTLDGAKAAYAAKSAELFGSFAPGMS